MNTLGLSLLSVSRVRPAKQSLLVMTVNGLGVITSLDAGILSNGSVNHAINLKYWIGWKAIPRDVAVPSI